MQSMIVSEFFINEYFLFNKDYTQNDLVAQITEKIPSIFNYQFNDKNLLLNALTHKSFAHEVKVSLENNEKLEFLGDSVLQIFVSEFLYENFKDLDEGALSKLRSAIVNEKTLSEIANFYKINCYILLGKGELKNKGHEKDSILSDTFEALLGAIYLDAGYTKTKEIFMTLIKNYEQLAKPIFDQSIILDFDAKSRLQEVVMAKYKSNPKYVSHEISQNSFEVKIFINNVEVNSVIHSSKKKAMQILAKQVLENNQI